MAELHIPGLRANVSEQGCCWLCEQLAGAVNVWLTGPQEVPVNVAVMVPIAPVDGKLLKAKLYVLTVGETGKVRLSDPFVTVREPDEGPLAIVTAPLIVKLLVAELQSVGAIASDTEHSCC